MKINKYNPQTGQGHATIKIELKITSETIEEIIVGMLEREKPISKKSVTEEIRFRTGDIMTGVNLAGVQFSDEIKKSKELSKKLFPEFYIDYRL